MAIISQSMCKWHNLLRTQKVNKGFPPCILFSTHDIKLKVLLKNKANSLIGEVDSIR